MPFAQVVSSAVEFTINRLIRLDESAEQGLQPLAGKQLKVSLDELPFPLVFHFTEQIEVLTEHQDHPLTADCSLGMSLATVQKLQDTSQLSQLIQSKQLRLDGDIQVAQQFSQLLKNLDIDWEEQLSKYVGDVAAHNMVAAKERLHGRLKQAQQQLRRTLSDAAIEEKQLMAHPLQVAHFSDQVDDVRGHAARLEARLTLLEKRLNPTKPSTQGS